MSDLESVDLSQESESEASEDMSPPQQTQPPPPASKPSRDDPPSVPHRTSQRDNTTKPATKGTQNGTIAPEKNPKEGREATTPARPAAAKPATQTPKPVSHKPAEKASEKPTDAGNQPKNAPPKPKRGRPRKSKAQQRSDDVAGAEPQSPSKPTPGAKPLAALKPVASKQAAAPSRPATGTKPTAPPKPVASKQATAPKPGTKPAEGEAPRTGGRGRKRRLATKPIQSSQEDKQESAPSAGVSSSQQTQAPEREGPPQKPAPKPTEKKLYGAAKAAALKRRREEEEGRVSIAPVSKSSRGRRKDNATSTPEVSEVPAVSPPKGRPPKRVRRQPPKDIPRPVPQEVIRIEDDDIAMELAPAAIPMDKASAKLAQIKNGSSQENANAPTVRVGNAAPSRGRQSLPANSFARPALRRTRARDASFAAPVNRELDGPSQDMPRREGDGPSQDKDRDIRIQTQNEVAKPSGAARPRRAHTVRHSTGNIDAMDTDALLEQEANEHINRTSNHEAVKSMLDEIQRNAIPFLLSQDRICDWFSTRIGEDVDVVLKNSSNDAFQVFSDRVKDALIADRLRLAVASAKTELRRGIEKLLREFARKVGAPLTEADSSLLLRNEAFRKHSRAKGEKIVSKPVAVASPRIAKAITPRRVAEDSNHVEEASDRDDLSDAEDPIITTPRQLALKTDIPVLSNVAELRKFVGFSYHHLNLECDRSCAILKLCAQPGGMTVARLHALTPLGRAMIRTKTKNLVDRGYLVEDVIRDGDKNITVFSTAAHVSDT